MHRLEKIIEELRHERSMQTSRIAQGIFSVIQRIKQFPDAFSCVQDWVSYDDVVFVDQMKSFGAGELMDLLHEILEQTHKLIRPTMPLPCPFLFAPTIAHIRERRTSSIPRTETQTRQITQDEIKLTVT